MPDKPKFGVYFSHSWRPRDVDLNLLAWSEINSECELLVDAPRRAVGPARPPVSSGFARRHGRPRCGQVFSPPGFGPAPVSAWQGNRRRMVWARGEIIVQTFFGKPGAPARGRFGRPPVPRRPTARTGVAFADRTTGGAPDPARFAAIRCESTSRASSRSRRTESRGAPRAR
jgi:hypothetical protein